MEHRITARIAVRKWTVNHMKQNSNIIAEWVPDPFDHDPDRSTCECLKLTKKRGNLSYNEVVEWLFDNRYSGGHFQMDIYVPEGLCDSFDFEDELPDHRDYWIIREVETL